MSEHNAREQEFKDKLFALLREYDVTMEVQENCRNWTTVVEGITFEAPAKWDADGNIIVPEINLHLSTYENGT